MKTQYDFTRPGGFPVDQTLYADFQEGINDAQSVTRIMGDMVIMSGGVDDGNGNISAGVLAIDGEILPFAGGLLQATVFVESVEVGGVFQDGFTKPIKNIRTVRFGIGPEQYNWSDFRTSNGLLARIEKLERMCAPMAIGTVLLWNKAANLIPSGWQECVDFRGRMPQGYDPADADFNSLGKTGGEKAVTLAQASLPDVKIGNGVIDDKPVGDSQNAFVNGQKGSTWTLGDMGNSGNDSLKYQGLTENLGEGKPHNNMPPYRVVMFIEFVG